MSAADSASASEARALYEVARKELVSALAKKRSADKALATLEAQLYAFEGSYLTETANSGGNIIQGFDSYLKGGSAAGRKKHEITDADRIFSNSSSTYTRSLQLQQELSQSPPPSEYPTPVQGLRTVSLPPQPDQPTTASRSKKETAKDKKRRRTGGGKAGTESADEEGSVTGGRGGSRKRPRFNED